MGGGNQELPSGNNQRGRTSQVNVERLYYETVPISMVAGEGIYLYDEFGREYLDCASGTFNMSLGYRHPDVIRAIKDQADKLVHITSEFQSEPILKLADRLIELAPDGLTRAHPKVCGGSVANEGAIKIAQRATGRSDVITLFRSHLGQTAMTTALSGNAFRQATAPTPGIRWLNVPDPYCFRCFYDKHPSSCGLACVSKINDFIEFASSGNIAAVVVEPVSGNGGNIVPPKNYFTELLDLCKIHGIKLILDEVQTGIGRTGYMFAADYFGVTPDAITLGKGLGGSGAQIAAILTTEELSGLPRNELSFTFGSNLLSAAAANATLDIVSDPSFLENVRNVGARIQENLRSLQDRFTFIGDVRGLGLMIGVEIVDRQGRPDPALTNSLAKRALAHGMIIRTSRYGRGNVLKVRPPLTLSSAQADNICDRLEALFQQGDA